MDESELASHRGMVCRFLLFLLRDAEAADEITQETFKVALSKGTDPTKGTNFGAWLRSIARNLVQNHLRKQRTRPLLLHEGVAELAERHFVETGSDQDTVWEARREALEACMQKLSEDGRRLLRLRYASGRKVREIAGEMEMEPNTLSKRLERIRTELRCCIDASVEEKRDE